ncbi:MAG: exodeoxyribonuclease VII small subunit [Clostridia bacterium]|nr:exodeoxyribonuclease VII small subunit [Clostridia bacterium]
MGVCGCVSWKNERGILLAKKQATFEDKLMELEGLVRKMESGSLPLSEALDAYEAGMKLSRQLTEELSAAEKRMLELSDGRTVPMEDAP